MHVTDNRTSGSTGNSYFDVHFKTSPAEQETVRVMKKCNPSLNRTFFIQKKQLPVKLCNLSKASDVLFYNSYYGSFVDEAKLVPFKSTDLHFHAIAEIKKSATGFYNVKGNFQWWGKEELKTKKDGTTERLREGVIVDESKSYLPISIWGNLIDIIVEEKVHEFAQIQAKYYYSILKLGTTHMTQIVVSPEEIKVDWTVIQMIDWAKIEQQEKEKSFPTILGAFASCEIDIFPKCISCKKKIVVPTGEKRFSCPSCNRRLLASKLPVGFTGNVDVEDGDNLLQLTFFSDVLVPFFGENFLDVYQNQKQTLEDKILDLSDEVKITYSAAKKVITKIIQVEDKDEDI